MNLLLQIIYQEKNNTDLQIFKKNSIQKIYNLEQFQIS